jgi:uncharacterized delta-60 repeat protein
LFWHFVKFKLPFEKNNDKYVIIKFLLLILQKYLTYLILNITSHENFIYFYFNVYINIVFCQSPLDGQKTEAQIKIFISKNIKSYNLGFKKLKEIEESMKSESLNHNLKFDQKNLDKTIYAIKELELRKQFFKENPSKTFTSQDLLKANKGILQLCADGDFEAGLPTTNPYVFTSGNTDATLGADIDTSGFTQFFPNATTVNNFGAFATLVSVGFDPTIPTVSRVNSGNRALKLNFQQASILATDVVTVSKNFSINQNFFDFNYNLILNDPGAGHTPNQKPFFSVRIYDSARVLLKKVNILSDPADCTLTATSPPPGFGGTILTTGWRCARIDTTDLNLFNEPVTVEFVIADCSLGGHFGTVYIDDICNSNCTNPIFGSINLDYRSGGFCPTTTQVICGTYQLPLNSQSQSVVLNVIQNGLIVGSVPAPSTLTASTFCFNVPVSTFGPNPLGDFDYQVVGNFVRTCAINYQLQPLVANNTDYLNPDVAFYPARAFADNFTVSCNSNPVFNVLSNDINVGCNFTATASNVTITQITSNPNIIFNTSTGSVQLVASAPAGTYSMQYQICSLALLGQCSNYTTVTLTKSPTIIDAVDDDYSALPFAPCTNISFKFLDNDRLCGSPINLSDVILSLPSPILIPGATISSLGIITLPSNLISGTYGLVYKICQTSNPTNCDTATIKFIISPANIIAVNDNFSLIPINNVTGGTSSSVLTNDSYNGGSITTSLGLTLNLVSPISLTGATINNLGVVTVPPNTTPGYYTLTYRLSNCFSSRTATVRLFVESALINFTSVRANSAVKQIALQSTGKIIIIGSFSNYNNIIINSYIARLNTDLSLDTSFATISGLQQFQNISIQSDDKIIMVGQNLPKGIIRLNSNGSIDPTFNLGGAGFPLSNSIPHCGIQLDGKILVSCGLPTTYNGVNVKNLIRLNTDGTLDPTFIMPFNDTPATSTTTGNLQIRGIRKFALQPNGKIIVASLNGVPFPNLIGEQPSLFRINSDGSLDTTFQFGWTGARNFNQPGQDISTNPCLSCYGPIEDIEILTSGEIIVAGSFLTYNGTTVKNIVKLGTTGILDGTFNSNSSTDKGILDVEQDIDIISGLANGIFIAGEFSTYSNTLQTADRLTRIGLNGIKSPNFNTGTTPILGNLSSYITSSGPVSYIRKTVNALKRQPDKKVILGGFFSKYNNINAENITRINPTIGGNQSKVSLNNSEYNISFSDKIIPYPNPFNDKIIIDLSDILIDYDLITITNILGKIVYQEKLIAKAVNEIGLTNLSSGCYFARLSNIESNVFVKLVKR